MIIIHMTTNFAAVCHMLLLCKGVCQCSAIILTGKKKLNMGTYKNTAMGTYENIIAL